MLFSKQSRRGMVTAPHHLAAGAGLDILREGGNAIEAAIATAAALCTCYPHMTGLGGDTIWLIAEGDTPLAIDAAGPAAAGAGPDFYAMRELKTIPARGPRAALTVPGAAAGWQAALAVSARWGGRLPFKRLVADAVWFARNGVTAPQTLVNAREAKRAELADVPGWAGLFDKPGEALFRNPDFAGLLEHLARAGLNDLYRGDSAREIARACEAVDSPLRLDDLEQYQPWSGEPLRLGLTRPPARLFNAPPPTQGLASLLILGLFSRLGVSEGEGFDHIHGLIEATKRAFRLRDTAVTDPAFMTIDPTSVLDAAWLDGEAAAIDPRRAAPYPHATPGGDTVWFGVIDGEGRMVSAIQSLYWEFGSGFVAGKTGLALQNRGTSFSLANDALNRLQPGRRPFHTIQPAMALFDDGRRMVYGTMGGEGQPQTQAALFTRYAFFGQDLQAAVTAPRWLLGRTWGATRAGLTLESRFDPILIDALEEAGHELTLTGPFEETMGHAGAIVVRPNGCFDGASDPRSDGAALGF